MGLFDKIKTTIVAKKAGLTVCEYDRYLSDYQSVYTLDRYKVFLKAEANNLTIKEYEEWQNSYSNYELKQFKDFLIAREQGLTLVEYYDLQESSRLGLSIVEYRKYKTAKELNLTLEEFEVYERFKDEKKLGKKSIISSLAELKCAEKAGLKIVIIGAKCENIPQNTFQDSSFEEIVLSWGIKTIGSNAFENSSIKKIVVPGTVSELPRNVFKGCNELEEIEILYGVKTIDITGWDVLPKLKSIATAGSVKTFNIDTSSNYKFLYSEKVDQELYLVSEFEKSQIKILEMAYPGFSAAFQFKNVEVLIINTNINAGELRSILFAMSKLRILIVDGCMASTQEKTKNGRMKEIEVPWFILLLENNPQLKFVIIREKGAGVRGSDIYKDLVWVHLPEGDNMGPMRGVYDIPNLMAIGISPNCITLPKSVKKVLFNRPSDCLPEDIVPIRLIGIKNSIQEGVIEEVAYASTDHKEEYNLLQYTECDAIHLLEGTTKIYSKQFYNTFIKKIYFPLSLECIEADGFGGDTRIDKICCEKLPENIDIEAFGDEYYYDDCYERLRAIGLPIPERSMDANVYEEPLSAELEKKIINVRKQREEKKQKIEKEKNRLALERQKEQKYLEEQEKLRLTTSAIETLTFSLEVKLKKSSCENKQKTSRVIETKKVEPVKININEEEMRMIVTKRQDKARQVETEIIEKKKRENYIQTDAVATAPIEQVGGNKIITNNLFSFTYRQNTEVEICKKYEVFFISDIGEIISKSYVFDIPKNGEQFKLSFELLAGLEFDSKKTYYLIVKTQDTEEILGKIDYKINIAFASDFDF